MAEGGVLGEFYAILGFKADTMKLKEFVSAIGDLDMRTVAAALGLGVLYDATYKIMNIADQTAMSMFEFSQVTGMSGEKMEQLSSITKQFGGGAKDAQSSLKGIQSALTDMQLSGGGMASVLTHIDVFNDTPFEAMSKAFEFFKDPGFNDGIKIRIARMLGLSESMIVVAKNTKSFSEAIKDQTHLSGPSEQALVRQSMAVNKLNSDWSVFISEVGGKLAPTLERVATTFDNIVIFADKHPEITSALSALVQGLLAIGSAIATIKIAEFLFSMLTGLGELRITIAIIVAGLTLIAANWGWIQEQHDKEVRLIFVCGTSAKASEFGDALLRQLASGALNITVMGKPTSIEDGNHD